VPTPSRNSGIRLLETVILVLALLAGLRLFQVQIIDHGSYLAQANRQWTRKLSLPAPRGNLYDRSGIPLAVGTLQYKVSADPAAFRKLAGEARKELLVELAALLDIPRAKLKRQLTAKGRYSILHEGISLALEHRERLVATGIVHLEQCARRLYPMGALGAPLLGFLNADGEGVAGLEAGLQAELAGRPGMALVQKDENGRNLISPLNRRLVEPERGSDVYLTLDHKVQAIVDQELARAAKEAGARAGSAVVLDPHTGEILALSSWPVVADREADRYRPEEWKLLPVQAIYEPGSTMKALTSIALLEKGDVSLATQVDAEDGQAVIDGFRIRDDRPHLGHLSFREAFALSSNICFAKLSSRLSKQQLFGLLQDLGFGNSCGLPLPGELGGKLRKPGEWSGRSKLTLIFGQELTATPLQMTAALGALATDGLLMKPHILGSVVTPDGRRRHDREPVLLRRVCRQETAATIRGLMGDVVTDGTGRRARVAGLEVGGKTGTAQKFEGGSLKLGKYLASFVGLAPLDAPRLVVGVFLDEPSQEMAHGGRSAAPAFSRIVEKLAVATPRLLASPDESTDRDEEWEGAPVPSFLEQDLAAAELGAREAGLPMRFRGHGTRVVAQEPDPGCLRRADELLVLVLGDPESQETSVPDLVGLSLRAARRRALERGYRILPRGRGVVLEQGRPDRERGGVIPLRLGVGVGS
jgi:cell division protein FtsI/penicillin-binding protein 2